ncbi:MULTISPECIES: TetR family transcriptional regulator [Rhizobium]|uniref:AcrR family transcriptional regulator n=2 Tax=Rhizobium TaxID=379 RepID=A0A7W6Q7E9_9HYPH|nr:MULTISPECIES: TetR family transcriptional regulator [Rhizobium]ARO25771.1 TetR family transcriptional regulator protein [Rhizobium sp. TAL182]MBB4191403.1 AcrR family transcriptional regulator [Rhizobium aethiopicum]MBB4578617.1 AcrR family transcriptional regulator [Rhizobium aethiopicum]MBX4907559.1 TetR/AcrR family transcriptional regulator [Rhizobium bangladeshense]MBX5215320.1 TetR/AcrR family transcriptional regulator [Rhizobium sp. NLR9a]
MNDIAENTLDVTRQENVTRILDAAERLFRHYGYSKTTVADIARDLGMSPANIYRFFASKVEIHQALCGRMLATCYQLAYDIRHQPLSASERLRLYVETQYQWTMDTMLDEMKVHEMIVVAIERDWHVIEKHIDRVHDLIAEIIAEGIAAGEFAEQDPVVASRCFGAATINLCHPQMVAQCLAKTNRASVDELIDYVIRALKK